MCSLTQNAHAHMCIHIYKTLQLAKDEQEAPLWSSLNQHTVPMSLAPLNGLGTDTPQSDSQRSKGPHPIPPSALHAPLVSFQPSGCSVVH